MTATRGMPVSIFVPSALVHSPYEAPYFPQLLGIKFPETPRQVVGYSDVVRVYSEVLKCNMYRKERRREEETEEESMRHWGGRGTRVPRTANSKPAATDLHATRAADALERIQLVHSPCLARSWIRSRLTTTPCIFYGLRVSS